MFKKTISSLLALCLLLAMIPYSAFAAVDMIKETDIAKKAIRQQEKQTTLFNDITMDEILSIVKKLIPEDCPVTLSFSKESDLRVYNATTEKAGSVFANFAFTCEDAAIVRSAVHEMFARIGAGNVIGGGDWGADRLMPDVIAAAVAGRPVELLWVTGSGGDLGTLTESNLAVLRLDRLRALTGVYPGVEREDEMVAAFDYCLHGKGGAAPSIDTAMHGLVDAPHVDHLHPDSGIALATAAACSAW